MDRGQGIWILLEILVVCVTSNKRREDTWRRPFDVCREKGRITSENLNVEDQDMGSSYSTDREKSDDYDYPSCSCDEFCNKLTGYLQLSWSRPLMGVDLNWSGTLSI